MLDGELEAIYREDHAFYTPRFTPIMKALSANDHLTVKEIAALSSVSHSAASQTVAKMSDHGLVSIDLDTDKRGRRVALTAEGRRLLPWLERHWSATTMAANDLEEELSHSLNRLLRDAIERLEARSFSERIRQSLAAAEEGRSL